MIPPVGLQSSFDKLMDGDWWAVTDPYFDVMGVLFVGVVGVAVLGSVYINSDSIALPAVLAMLGGGVLAQYAPAPVTRGAFLLIYGGIVLVVTLLYVQRRGR